MHPRPGLFRIATVREVPIFVHWSFPAGGLVLCVLSGFNQLASVWEFVGEELTRHLGLDHDAAVLLMLDIHRQGGAMVIVADWEKAQAIADAITRDARAHGHPLVCRAESVAESEKPQPATHA